jgi:mono/diheme cytochrome c family protein
MIWSVRRKSRARFPSPPSPGPGARMIWSAVWVGLASWGVVALSAEGVDRSPPGIVGSGFAAVDTVGDWGRSGDPESSDPVERGLYLARAGNCIACHSADLEDPSAFMSGGKSIPSPFGTFQSTNITPHPTRGIGRWSEADFVRSMREGRSPSGEHYYPAFPYTAYTGMTDRDLSDLYAFLRAVPAVDRQNQPHDLTWFANVGAGLAAWKVLNFREWRFEADRARGEEWNRGAYLSQAVAHCAECHSPRTRTGRIVANRRYAGAAQGPDGQPTPNITPHATGIEGWTQRHMLRYLEFGMTPDGDFAGGSMAEVISIGTSHLTLEDRRALATYILSLSPIRN